jgi:hypothetical protein
MPLLIMGQLKNYLAFRQKNVQSFQEFCGQIMPSYLCTIPKTRVGTGLWKVPIEFRHSRSWWATEFARK